MSLKDRLNLEKTTEQNILTDTDKHLDILKKILEDNQNILISCPLKISTGEACNFLCKILPEDKRIVAIGSNLILNQKEIIKFEPDINNSSKELIKTALNLNPYKIILQDFQGAEAVDIFKYINADIKNIITATVASNAQKALSQAELNLYLSGINVPEKFMKKQILSFIDKIVELDKRGRNNIFVSNIYEIKSYTDEEYTLSSMVTPSKAVKTTKKSTPSNNELKSNQIISEENVKPKKEISPKNKLISKLKRKNSK